jgi:hypothetical protein
MRFRAVLAILIGCLALSCAGPKLRESAKVKPKAIHNSCGAVEGQALTEEQALCVARLSGLSLDEGRYSIRRGLSQQGAETWVIEELCDRDNPECIGVVVRCSDGKILGTRYLYMIKEYGTAIP